MKRKYERPRTRAIEIQHMQMLAQSPAGMKGRNTYQAEDTNPFGNLSD